MARNSYTETTRKGFGKRLTDSIGAAVIGGLMFIAAFPALWWNEGRAIGEYRALKEGAGAVVHVAAAPVGAGNEGKLVHVSALVEGAPELVDDDLDVSVDGLALRRVVEMYQWQETRDSKERKTLGGGSETVTEYKYETEWNDDPIDSSDFRYSDEHANPTEWPLSSATFEAEKTTVGAFVLSDATRAAVGEWRDLDAAKALRFPDAYEQFRGIGSGRLFSGADPEVPEVGDMRIRYEYQPEETFSIVARQDGETLDTYTASNGRSVLLVEPGEMAAAAMFDGAQKRNTMITWAVRAGGMIAMWIGLAMVFAPISRVLDILPMLGTIGSWGIGLVTGLISLVLSVLTIAVSWVFYRPVLGVTLILAVLAAFLWLRGRKPAPPSMPPAMMPPPPPPPL